jgi:hypothetical protein
VAHPLVPRPSLPPPCRGFSIPPSVPGRDRVTGGNCEGQCEGHCSRCRWAEAPSSRRMGLCGARAERYEEGQGECAIRSTARTVSYSIRPVAGSTLTPRFTQARTTPASCAGWAVPARRKVTPHRTTSRRGGLSWRAHDGS